MNSPKSSLSRQYILAQLFFWSLYGGFNLLLIAIFNRLQPLNVVIVVTLCLLSALASHLMRLAYKRWARDWTLTRVVLLALVVIPLMALLVQLSLIACNAIMFNLFPSLEQQAYAPTLNVVFMYVLNLSVILALWTAIYLSVDQFRRRRETEIAHWKTTARLHEAELQFLRSQINSHFLFNALNNLRALIRENPELARQRLTQLATLLRAILQAEQRDKVTLETELDIVRGYLDLEALQFEQRLGVEWVIDEATKAFAVPPMLLQTLVENAVKHGIACRRDGGIITIKSSRDNDKWRLEISNPLPDSESRSDGTGLGLQNTRERLQRIFGTGAGLELRRQPDRVLAIVEIPV